MFNEYDERMDKTWTKKRREQESDKILIPNQAEEEDTHLKGSLLQTSYFMKLGT